MTKRQSCVDATMMPTVRSTSLSSKKTCVSWRDRVRPLKLKMARLRMRQRPMKTEKLKVRSKKQLETMTNKTTSRELRMLKRIGRDPLSKLQRKTDMVLQGNALDSPPPTT